MVIRQWRDLGEIVSIIRRQPLERRREERDWKVCWVGANGEAEGEPASGSASASGSGISLPSLSQCLLLLRLFSSNCFSVSMVESAKE